ncbi:NusG domain II-containing protein [Ectothiorhodospiraceae bacterium WFHF3C12]|nr:NusG domain II-containing protein [Ectothiorhodospiraceae bacterium WFHF3C12]
MRRIPVTFTDCAVLAGALTLLAALYLGLWSPAGQAGSRASIWVSGEQRQSLDLETSRTIRVSGALGESVIEVRDGRVRVADSPGRQKLCVEAGWLSRSGESAICLPNQVVVRIESPQPRFDTVNF